MSSSEVVDKRGEPIRPGDGMVTEIQGHKRADIVSDVVATKEDARRQDVQNPPKVVFEDAHGENLR